MADDGKLDCSSPLTTVDPDIVGPGVLTAFIATATITIVAVIFGYLSDTLDDDLLNFLDRRIILWTRTRWRRFMKSARTVEEAATGHHSHHHAKVVAGIRKEVITQFILTLSDQQLVTGLAVLIAGVCNQRTLTGYQFSVILSQAWFSSTTHMATLDALRNYLGSHGIVRDIRVAGMLAVLILLIYTFVVSLLTRPQKMLPVQCLFERPFYFDPGYPEAGAAAAMSLAWISATYIFRIQDLYVRQRSPLYLLKWLMWRRRPVGSSFRHHFAEQKARSRFQAACKLADASRVHRVVYGYGDSFLSSIPGVAFSFSYGITQVVVTRWKSAPITLPVEASRMGFGQIMPVLLLCLPFLSAGESYYDYLHKRYQHLVAAAEQHHDPNHVEQTDTTSKDIQPSILALSPSIPETKREVVTAAERYDQDRSRIAKYFYADVQGVASTPKINTNSEEISQRKHSIVSRYQTVEEFEKHIAAGPAVALFACLLILAIATGIMLSIGNGYALDAVIPLTVISVGIRAMISAKSP